MTEKTKTVSVYVPTFLYDKMQQAMGDEGWHSDSGYIVHVLRRHLEEK